ncbi:MAG: hypothetical protein AB1411_15930 [Nitrospirota bacterium]
MNKKMRMCNTLLLACEILGWWGCLLCLPGPAFAEIDVTLGTGIGSERLAWSIAGPGGRPNILSELTFQRTETVVGFVKSAWRHQDWRLDLELDGGVLQSGSVRDEDFAGNNRQGLLIRSMSQIDGNMLWAARGGVEYRWLNQSWSQSWLRIGGIFSQQTYRIVDGVQDVPTLSAIDRLNSTYRARWYGPELGLKEYLPLGRSAFALTGEVAWWPWLRYDGQGTWNRRSDLRQDPSFTHTATGWGVGTDAALAWSFLKDRAWMSLGWRWQWMETGRGTARTFFSNGTSSEVQFNGAARQSQLYYFSASATF